MKTYTFFILSSCITFSVDANTKQDAMETVAHQFNVKNMALIECLGVNLKDKENGRTHNPRQS